MEENINNLPEGWTISSFGNDDFKIIGSGVKYFENSKNYLSTSSIEKDNVLFVEEEITFNHRPSRANMQPIENSIWFAKMKNTIKIFYPQKSDLADVILSTGFCGVYSSSIELGLIKQILLSKNFNSQKDLLAEGSTQEAVNNFKVKKIKFPLPKSKNEQNKIAEILSKVDKAISETEILIAKYNQIKTGIMQDLLTSGIDKNGNIRSEETHEFIDSPFGRIPKEWECLTIEKVKDFVTSGSRGWAQYYSIEGSKFIRITNLRRDQIEIDLSDLKFVKLPLSIEGVRSKLQEGDLLVSITADLGIIGVVSSSIGEAFVNQHISLVRLNRDLLNSKFTGYFLSSSYGQSIFNLLNDGGAKAGLNLRTINNLFVLKPELDEQKLIVEKIEKSNDAILKLRIEYDKLKAIKTGLMQDLLSGKKRVTHLI